MPDPAPLRVLVVDDENAVRDLLIDVLTLEGYEAEGVATAAAGLEAARVRPPVLVLLDLHLPGAVSGFDVMGAFLRAAPVVVISGTRDAELAREALRRGAFDYLTKPFAITRLAAVVAAAIRHGRGGA